MIFFEVASFFKREVHFDQQFSVPAKCKINKSLNITKFEVRRIRLDALPLVNPCNTAVNIGSAMNRVFWVKLKNLSQGRINMRVLEVDKWSGRDSPIKI